METKAPKDKYNALLKCIEDKTRTYFVHVQSDYLPLNFAFGEILKSFKLPPSGYDPEFIAALAENGILPFSDGFSLIPKLHLSRCIASLQENSLQQFLAKSQEKGLGQFIKLKPLIKCAKQINKEIKAGPSRRFLLRFNKAPEEILRFTKTHHSNFWLSANLQANLLELAKQSWVKDHPGFQAVFCDLALLEDSGQKATLLSTDIGYRAGAMYTSMSGASERGRPSVGSLHLLLLKELLFSGGFRCWDLGMHIDYKIGLAARSVPRQVFLGVVDYCRKSAGVFPIEDIDVGAFEPFREFIAWIEKFEEEKAERIKKLKMSRRLSAEDCLVQRSVPPEQWSADFLRRWMRTKIGEELGEEALGSEGGLAEAMVKMSKRRAKKIKRLFGKLAKRHKENEKKEGE